MLYKLFNPIVFFIFMEKFLIHTPCALLLFDEQKCALSAVSTFDAEVRKKVQAVVCDGFVFALNRFGNRLLTELSLDEACLKAIAPKDMAQAEKAKNNSLLKKTIAMLRSHCEIDDGVVMSPLLIWQK